LKKIWKDSKILNTYYRDNKIENGLWKWIKTPYELI
jgi:hypothetical protein